MKLLEIADYPFNRVTIEWHGPFQWPKNSSRPALDPEVGKQPGIYRAEIRGRGTRVIKYIGSASDSFAARLTKQHRILRDLVNKSIRSRRVELFLGVLQPERRIRLDRKQHVEIEYILQQVHWHDLISWHGLMKLPRTQRGEGWRITNAGQRGRLSRVIAYPAFGVAGQDRE